MRAVEGWCDVARIVEGKRSRAAFGLVQVYGERPFEGGGGDWVGAICKLLMGGVRLIS